MDKISYDSAGRLARNVPVPFARRLIWAAQAVYFAVLAGSPHPFESVRGRLAPCSLPELLTPEEILGLDYLLLCVLAEEGGVTPQFFIDAAKTGYAPSVVND